jgi:flagellar basal body-associated protein FliL
MAQRKEASAPKKAVKNPIIRDGLKALGAHVREIAHGLRSPDRPTRRMALLFFASLAGMLVVFGIGVKSYVQGHVDLHASQKDAAHLSEFFERRAEEAKRKFVLQNLGEYTLELKAPGGEARKVPGVLNMAEIELVAECDTHETCNYIEEHIPSVRDQVTNVFVAIGRDELISREGKRRLKKNLVDRLNVWLPKGRVENIYFNKLIVS